MKNKNHVSINKFEDESIIDKGHTISKYQLKMEGYRSEMISKLGKCILLYT